MRLPTAILLTPQCRGVRQAAPPGDIKSPEAGIPAVVLSPGTRQGCRLDAGPSRRSASSAASQSAASRSWPWTSPSRSRCREKRSWSVLPYTPAPVMRSTFDPSSLQPREVRSEQIIGVAQGLSGRCGRDGVDGVPAAAGGLGPPSRRPALAYGVAMWESG
jgi:hypothetical protein